MRGAPYRQSQPCNAARAPVSGPFFDLLLCLALRYFGLPLFERTRSSTNRRTAEDRFPPLRDFSISVASCDTVTPWVCAISFRVVQNESSRVIWVLRPSM